ncbi:hypothetical protein D9M68_942750 [compost metagenome]
MKTLLLYFATAIAEIVGCYLPLLWLRGEVGRGWLLHIDIDVDLGVGYAHTVGGCLHEGVVGRVTGSER